MGRGWGEQGAGVGDQLRTAGASRVQEQSLEGLGAKLGGLGSGAGGVGVAELEVLESRGSRADSVGKRGWYGWREGW